MAIDLDRVETRHARTPALLLLDGVEIDIPPGGPPVYSMTTLPAFFAALYPSRIDEVISWDSAVCQYSGRLGIGCSLCSEACSQGAISRNCEGIDVDPVLCVECGSCVSVCPTGALQYQRFPDQVFVDYCRDMPLQPGATIILGSESKLHTLWWRRNPAAAGYPDVP
jgi:ferredoxin